ncbi:hypothetical protein MHYP_G00106080 [Metynnis hypsauchen]
MSSVKEECEDVSVMEATGLKTEDQQMDEVRKTETYCTPPQSVLMLSRRGHCCNTLHMVHLKPRKEEEEEEEEEEHYTVTQAVLRLRLRESSCVKEECEDISVMEVTGLKTEDQQMDKEEVFREDIKEEHKPEVKLFQELQAVFLTCRSVSSCVLDLSDIRRLCS